MLFYADRISDNIRKREPEGYLICVNVPIARSGTQQYLQDELGQHGSDAVTVYRPEEEVFSKATMASFEGMPVTNDHPDDDGGVTAENIGYLQKGHCQNVRRGTGPDKDLLIADLVITDPKTIQDVLDGKREISCGYNYELDEENGKYIQRQIRGNHIAIVDKGRAGHRVCIKDSAPNTERSKTEMAKKNHNRILSKMLAAFVANDAAAPEDIEEAVDAIEDITTEEPAEPPVEPEAQDAEPGEDPIAEIMRRLDALEAAVGNKGADEDPEMDPLQALEKDLDEIEAQEAPAEEEPMQPEEDESEPEAHFVDPEEINEQDADEIVEEEEEEEIPVGDCGPGKKANDAIRAAIAAVKPVIAQLPPSQRKKAADAAAATLRKATGLPSKATGNNYLKLKARKKAADSKAPDFASLGRSIMASRNANYKK